LIRFLDHPVNEGLQSVFVLEGSAVEAGEHDNHASPVAFDVDNLSGIAIWQDLGGLVTVIGDADVWTNGVIEEADNLLLAMNCVQEASRMRLGRIEQDGENEVFYMIPNDEASFQFNVFNRGEGPLEIGAAPAGVPPGSTPVRDMRFIPAGSSQEVTVTISSDGFQPDQLLFGSLRLSHNDPDLDPINLSITLNVIDVNPRYFSPPRPTVETIAF
jgi:hypothetical protein